MRRIARFGCLWGLLFTATLAAAAARADEPITLCGQVLLPDGAPAAGAEVYWVNSITASPGMPDEIASDKPAATDEQGRFELSLEDARTRNKRRWNPPSRATAVRQLIACLPGYGAAWLEIVREQAPGEVVLRLVADNPICGRVIDTEGRPAVGATIAVTSVWASPSGSLDGFLAESENLRNGRAGHLARLLPPLKTVSDREGRFKLSGVGAERLAWVNISAAGLATEDLEVVNRDGFDAKHYDKAAGPGHKSSRLVGPVIEHVAETELVIRGTVFTGADHKPVVGAPVFSGSHGYPNFPRTDERGRFELRGLPRGTKARFSVYSPSDHNLLPRGISLDLAVGQQVVETEVELKEGIVIEGRVLDTATMRGVESEMRFVTLPDNHYVNQPGYDGFIPPVRTDGEGRFQILVPPGPSVLMAQVSVGGVLAQAEVATPYRQARFSEEDAKHVPNGPRGFFGVMSGRQVHLSLTIVNAVKFLNPPPDSGPVTCDLTLETGKTIKLAIEDEQGRLVNGALLSGMTDSMDHIRRVAEASCEILGLGTDRPRRIVIVQPERHLAGALRLTGDEPAQVTVRLTPTASMTGRVVDADGEPLIGAVVQTRYVGGGSFVATNGDQSAIKTGRDGQFRVENVLPGELFELVFLHAGKFFHVPGITDKKRVLQPGEQLELGEFKTKEVQ